MQVTLSEKFEIEIPKTLREILDLRPGDKVQVLAHQGRILVIPDDPMQNLQGRYKDLDLSFEREPDREL